MKLTLLLAFITFSFYCYSQTDKANTKISKDNFTIEYPKPWRLDTSRMMGTELIAFSPLENSQDKFSENVNVIIQDLGGKNIDLEKYKQITEQEIATMVADGKVIESFIVKNSKNNFFKIVYTMTQNTRRQKIISVCFIKDNKAYLATFTSELDKYDAYKKIGDEILNSFSLTN
jgi:hypothetical protein